VTALGVGWLASALQALDKDLTSWPTSIRESFETRVTKALNREEKPMNIVEQVARMIDAEGAYAEYWGSSDPNAEPMPQTVRQKYFRTGYECKAIEILQLVTGMATEKIIADLIEFEKEGWRKLGVPIDDVGNRIIHKKYLNHD
jgi:hypothetical protein